MIVEFCATVIFLLLGGIYFASAVILDLQGYIEGYKRAVAGEKLYSTRMRETLDQVHANYESEIVTLKRDHLRELLAAKTASDSHHAAWLKADDQLDKIREVLGNAN